MRKKTIKNLYETILWGIITLAPIIYFIGITFRSGSNTITFNDCISQFNIITNNVIGAGLEGIFGTDGVLPLFDNTSPIIKYMVYIINITLVRLFVEVILFIPKCAIKIMAMPFNAIGGKVDD